MTVRIVAEKYFAAWEARDLDTIMSLHSPDTIFRSYMGKEPVVGIAAVRAEFAAGLKLIPDISFKAWDMRFGDDFWVAQMVMSGSRNQPGASNARFSANCVDVIWVKNGLVKRKDSYMDTVQLMAQMGRSA